MSLNTISYFLTRTLITTHSKNNCLSTNINGLLCTENNLETVSIDLSKELNYPGGGTSGSTLLAKSLRNASDRLTKISIRLPPEVLDETSAAFRQAKIWRDRFFDDAEKHFESEGCSVGGSKGNPRRAQKRQGPQGPQAYSKKCLPGLGVGR
jgi:hypothetical protein